ncbi:hypothetical protein [Paracraurococcus ruber]|uniref:Uncharacterized protein n=1 Tax=Paracraurococcus ruber TaxID=77675 RepID=A0ABS1CXY2_9PROT|nr:hypothetical protein [Paracraurococcus ruber]MBK1658579.1 hypothetical protein [Paracraurococcus ruber]TDG27423.1 hypothetical protein E2C05_22950 [Paracraurococcus ruber]
MTKLRTTILAAIAALPLLGGAAQAHGWWAEGSGYGPPRPAYDPYWREREARRAWAEAERARDWARDAEFRRRAWEARHAWAPPPPPYGAPGWGPRW